MSTHTTVQCNSNKTHRGVCGLCRARSSESYLLLSVCVTCLVTQGLLHTPYHRLPPPTYTRARVKTSKEMAIQSPLNGKVKCYSGGSAPKASWTLQLLWPWRVAGGVNSFSSTPSAVQWNVKRQVNCALQVGIIRAITRILTLYMVLTEMTGNPWGFLISTTFYCWHVLGYSRCYFSLDERACFVYCSHNCGPVKVAKCPDIANIQFL